MPCARKRLHERRVILIDDIAFRMGYLCKRVLAFDLGAMNRVKFDTLKRMNRRSRSPDERRRDLTRGKDATYWSQTAASLTKEVAQLREDAKKRDREYSSLRECNSRLFVSYREMERKLNDAERELTYLRTDPFQESRLLFQRHIHHPSQHRGEGRDSTGIRRAEQCRLSIKRQSERLMKRPVNLFYYQNESKNWSPCFKINKTSMRVE
jgi:hypothetical protein